MSELIYIVLYFLNKSLNKKYEVQKTIIMQMEEKFMMSLHKPIAVGQGNACCSPDTDKTGININCNKNCIDFIKPQTLLIIFHRCGLIRRTEFTAINIIGFKRKSIH